MLFISGFTPLKAHYHTILKLMPDNYEQSVGKLQNYISDDQICMILSSSNSTTANKTILDCLIEKMSCKEELLNLCDQLETIATSHQLLMVISEIRSGGYCVVAVCSCLIINFDCTVYRYICIPSLN